MPITDPPYAVGGGLQWLQRRMLRNRKDFERNYPGHCGRCGLPHRLCFHEKSQYQRDIENAKDHTLLTSFEIRSAWYKLILSKMSREELAALPPPPPVWRQEVLVEAQEKDGLITRDVLSAQEARDSMVRKSAWERLLEDD